jgi:hypothetical protein
MLAPPPVSARGDWDDDDDHDGGYRHHHRHHEHGEWCPPRHGHRPPPPRYDYDGPYVAWAPGWYGPPQPVARARYYDEPCGRWYDDEDAFHYHIRHDHRIAEAVIPMVIGAAAFGWIFYGH